METRRSVLYKCGAGIATILMANKAPAVLVKSMRAASHSKFASDNLPYDAEVEYINIGPRQYVLPGWISSYSPDVFDTFDAEIRARSLSSEGWDFYMGGWNSAQGDGTIIRRNNKTQFANYCSYFRRFANNNPQINLYQEPLVRTDFIRTGLERTSDGQARWFLSFLSDTTKTPFHTYDIEFSLGGMPIGDVINYSTSDFDIKSFRLFQDGETLTHDLIPVRIGATGYLYDKVTEEFYGNNGEGEFLIGPDKMQKGV